MLPARELPWRFSDVTEVAWDTGSLAPGRYLLRAVTVVGAALTVPTEPVRVEVVAHEPAAPFPAPEAGRAAELEKAAAELAARESLLEERISVVSRREKALVRRYAQVEVTAPQPAAEAARPAEPPPPPPPPPEPPVARPEPAAPEPAPVPTIPPSPEPVRAAAGPAPGLWDLERLVAEHPDPDPYVQEERAALVYTLRAYASPDGLLPPEFHGLVEDAFGPLLG